MGDTPLLLNDDLEVITLGSDWVHNESLTEDFDQSIDQ